MVQIINKKKFFLMTILVAAVVVVAIWGIVNFKDRNNPENKIQVYEALVNIVDEKATDPVEDARSSLKKGDVIAIFPEGHEWSDTEKYSYLVVKLKIMEKEKQRLLQSKTKKVERENIQDDEKDKEMEKMGEETVLARQYRLNLPEFDVKKFWSDHQQPFADQVFGSEIIEKKQISN